MFCFDIIWFRIRIRYKIITDKDWIELLKPEKFGYQGSLHPRNWEPRTKLRANYHSNTSHAKRIRMNLLSRASFKSILLSFSTDNSQTRSDIERQWNYTLKFCFIVNRCVWYKHLVNRYKQHGWSKLWCMWETYGQRSFLWVKVPPPPCAPPFFDCSRFPGWLCFNSNDCSRLYSPPNPGQWWKQNRWRWPTNLPITTSDCRFSSFAIVVKKRAQSRLQKFLWCATYRQNESRLNIRRELDV